MFKLKYYSYLFFAIILINISNKSFSDNHNLNEVIELIPLEPSSYAYRGIIHYRNKSYQNAIYKDGIPSTMFFVDDLNVEFERLTSLGVNFKSEPTEMGSVKIAVFDDTCGNLISLCQQ